jgi:hypothetical protein
LLTGDKPLLWDTFQLNSARGLMPAKVSTEVRHKFTDLVGDYAINGNHHRFDLYLDEQRSQHQAWVTSDGLHSEEGWHAVPGWNLDSSGNCEFNLLDYGSFGGKYRLNEKTPVFEIKDTSLADLTSIWTGSGFARLVNPRSMTYNLPPLRVADALCADRSSSPLLRAYLLQALLSIMQQQPEDSGLLFAPELQNLSARLSDAGADQLHSGDWFITMRVTNLQPGLDKLFGELQTASYEQTATKFQTGVAEAAKDGFVFSGYVKPDGSPYWISTPNDGYVWGYQPGADEPGLLYVIQNGQAHAAGKAMPLTPLLSFAGDLPAVVAKAGVQDGNSQPKRWLPPLFASFLKHRSASE